MGRTHQVLHRRAAISTLAWLLGVTSLVGLAAQASAGMQVPAQRIFETKYYRVYSDLDAELTADLARRLDAMYEEYSRRLAGFQMPPGPRAEVHLFRREHDYRNFAGAKYSHTGGIFMSHRNAIAVFQEGQGRDAVRQTLQHEAFHQFAHQAISPQMPVWLNEGLAQVFEEGIWTGREFLLGQVPPRRIRQLRADMAAGRLQPFETFVRRTHDDWAAALSDRRTGSAQYNQAWAMVHFLVYATDGGGRPIYRDRLLTMLGLLHAGYDADRAFEACFGTNYAGFQDRFQEWARTLMPTPAAMQVENLTVLADLLQLLAERGTRFDSLEQFRRHITRANYRLNYTADAIEWQTHPDLTVYFADGHGRPLSGSQLFFAFGKRPLPDIVCRPSRDVQFRTRFHEEQAGLSYEIVAEVAD